jgi:YQGE family putative transporter
MRNIAAEYRAFLSCPRDMRVLMLANITFAVVMPIIEIFVAAYVMRNSHDAAKVVTYQLAIYTGIPVTFLVNGYLLRRIAMKHLYSFGMILSGGSLLALMSSDVVTPAGIATTGLLMGVATGFFAANRGFLALLTTDDTNRNYYYGVEMSAVTVTSVLVPLAVGWLIETAPAHGIFAGIKGGAYHAVAICACGITLISSLIVQRGRFKNPVIGRFLYWRYSTLWNRMLLLGALKGLAQGYILTAPAILILLLVGHEGALGTVQGLGGLLSAALLYAIGRMVQPRHRIHIFAAGLALFAVGSLVNAALFDVAGVLMLTACLCVAKPLLDLAYFPIQFAATDAVAKIEKRSQYAYVFSHECAEYLGRLAGACLFLAIAFGMTRIFALRFAMPVIGGLQLLSLPVASRMLRQVALQASTGSAG